MSDEEYEYEEEEEEVEEVLELSDEESEDEEGGEDYVPPDVGQSAAAPDERALAPPAGPALAKPLSLPEAHAGSGRSRAEEIEGKASCSGGRPFWRSLRRLRRSVELRRQFSELGSS